MNARLEFLDADGWLDWNAAGDIVFVAGPYRGERLGSVSTTRVASLAKAYTTPESATPPKEMREQQLRKNRESNRNKLQIPRDDFIPREKETEKMKNDPATLIEKECDALKALLLEKNAKYGNSALEPMRIFSKTDAVEQIRVRIDDKLSRLKNLGDASREDEDTVLDLAGYLILLRVAKKRKGTT